MKLSARVLLISVWGFLSAMIIGAPILMAHNFPAIASVLYFPFSFFCHQNPDRSFMLGSYPMTVCHRCCGIYLGFFLGTLFTYRRIYSSVKLRRAYVALAVLPMMIDFSLNFGGLWPGTPLVRFATGLIFGLMISPLLVHALEEMLQDVAWHRFTVDTLPIKGDCS